MHGLWNNAWFYLNGPHVLQGGPQNEEPAPGHPPKKGMSLNQFKEQGLDALAFPEYSDEFPHVQVRQNSIMMMVCDAIRPFTKYHPALLRHSLLSDLRDAQADPTFISTK